jgi:dienelactone hydrolase
VIRLGGGLFALQPQRFSAALILAATIAVPLAAQTSPDSLKPLLEQPIQPSAVTAYQLQRYLMKRIPKLPAPSSAKEFKAWQQKVRRHILDDVVFHGWPREWVESAPHFEPAGVIETDKGYRLRKLRYEIVPGFTGTAVLYEPENTRGRAPAILNVLGHEPNGIAAEYEQKRCINFAKRGIFALSMNWPGYGELGQFENEHDFSAHLDLVGANAVGLFYLAMRRGLDYLATLSAVDAKRLGVTGLSGGGWQTIVLSSLDERVAVAVEVAGFGSLESNLTHPVDTDEIEENPTDFDQGEDYTYLVALRAPRPTLLIHNAEDNCCFRAALVKPYIYDQIKPYFALLEAPDALAWHENRDPGTHNYQLDNRQQAYRFFTEHFGLAVATTEIPSDDELRTADQLGVGLPDGNLSIVGVARKLAAGINRATAPSAPGGSETNTSWLNSRRAQLKSVIRYTPVDIEGAWRLANTKHLGAETISYRFDLSNGLSATGLWLKAISGPTNAPATIVLSDKGIKPAGEVVSDRVNRGEQVLALDVLFNGANIPQVPDPADWEMLAAATGDRPLGLEAAQLLAVSHWLRASSGRSQIRIETDGLRSQVMALAAAALDPGTFSMIVTRHGISSLSHLVDDPVTFRSAPELFCLDLYKYFDLDSLKAMSPSTRVVDH